MIETREGISGQANYSDGEILNMLRDLPDACCIFEVVTDPFGTLKDMQFLFANEKYAALVGKSTAELIGSNFFSTVSNRDEDWLKLSYQAAIMRQSVINRTYNTQFNRWFEFWAVPVYKKGYCAFIIHDVTAEHRKETNREIATKSHSVIIQCAKILSSNDIETGINKVVELLGDVLGADRVYVVEELDDEIKDIYKWVNRKSGQGLPSRKDIKKHKLMELWSKQLQKDTIMIVEDTSYIQETEKEVYDKVISGKISRYIVAKLSDQEENIGYLAVDNQSPDISIDIKEVVESVAIFIAEELRISRLLDKMNQLKPR